MKAKFYICNHCGNLVTTIHNAGVPLVCCARRAVPKQAIGCMTMPRWNVCSRSYCSGNWNFR